MKASASANGDVLSSAEEFATVVVSRVVDAGREEDFRRWALRLISASEAFPSNRGTVVLSPMPGHDNVFRIVQRFGDAGSLRNWEGSATRERLSAEADAFSQPQRQMATGLEAWFQLTDTPAARPPRKWKMAITTFVVVYCLTSVLIPRELEWLPHSWSFYVINIVTNLLIATSMTYGIMPVTARLLRRWLY